MGFFVPALSEARRIVGPTAAAAPTVVAMVWRNCRRVEWIMVTLSYAF